VILVILRGDAHKLYLKVRSVYMHNKSVNIKELEEIQEIRNFYSLINSDKLKSIYYRMVKEKNGSGIVPILVTAIPWFFFLFSKQLHSFLFQHGILPWIIFSVFYLVTLTLSVIIHFREKAWAALHIEIIQDILSERNGFD
jgi:hypothetical protein